ncbi:hypothetical protein BCV69DRAFT_40059 [Microstroma glucosiphilum]|uniref:Transcription activator of gluconeogenesis ERT1 n=1 Tax=Pseudomicrostroma glucosiphilum TaxID=1684307 RepID=A0A316U276_9BASI|nr:hypothetical protein BCV69DRAFT_40059 [Pseudomicrostroma glucosiphilum]PWN19452.1 hypothetical protein BCV69DRAFT_40059 [Pseudomicrostroma glucosiphilum]
MPRIDKSRRVKGEGEDTQPSPPPPPSPPAVTTESHTSSTLPTPPIANMAYQQPTSQQSQHHASAGAGPYYSSQQALPPPSRGYVPAGSSVYGHIPSQHDVQQGGYQGSSAHMSYAAHPAHSYSSGLPIHPQYQHQQHQQPGQQPSSSYGEPHQYAGHVYQQQPGAYHTSQDDMYHPHHGSMGQSHHGAMSHLDNGNGHAPAAQGPTGGSGSDTSASALPHGMRPKRRQVKNACINCQKACKKCDEGRPCTRCIKYGLVDTCQDSMRKERKRGIKRGPYKRRATTGSSAQPGGASSSTVDSLQGQQHQGPPAPQPYHHADAPNGGGSSSGSYDSYHMAAPASYRPMQAGNGNGGPYTSSPSPSLFPRDQPRQQPNANDSRGAWAGPLTIDAPSRATYAQSVQPQSQQMQQQQFSQGQGSPVYPPAQQPQDFRSASAPLVPNLSSSSPSQNYIQGPPQSAGSANKMLPPSPMYGTFPLPSPTGANSRPSGAVFSPPSLSASTSSNGAIGNYLSSYGGASGQPTQLQRLHSDSSGISSASSGQFPSPRTPLSATEQIPGGMMSSANMAGSYIKSPVSSMAYPQPGQGGPTSGPGAPTSGPKPFPLQMPQFPRAKVEAKY